MRTIFLSLLLAFAATAHSQTLLTGFVSRHDTGHYREANTGIGVRLDSGPLQGWAAGTYRNSLDRQSVFVAREWQRQVAGPLYVGAIAGVATGYRWALAPIVMPELVLHVGRVEVAVFVQPLQLKESPRFVAMQLRFSFKE